MKVVEFHQESAIFTTFHYFGGESAESNPNIDSGYVLKHKNIAQIYIPAARAAGKCGFALRNHIRARECFPAKSVVFVEFGDFRKNVFSIEKSINLALVFIRFPSFLPSRQLYLCF